MSQLIYSSLPVGVKSNEYHLLSCGQTIIQYKTEAPFDLLCKGLIMLGRPTYFIRRCKAIPRIHIKNIDMGIKFIIDDNAITDF